MMIFYYFATAVWIVTAAVSWLNENRRIPMASLVLGVATQIGFWGFALGYGAIAVLGILSVICMFTVPDVFFGGKV